MTKHRYSITTDGDSALKLIDNETGEVVQHGIDGRLHPTDTTSYLKAWKQAREIRDRLECAQ